MTLVGLPEEQQKPPERSNTPRSANDDSDSNPTVLLEVDAVDSGLVERLADEARHQSLGAEGRHRQRRQEPAEEQE